MKLKGKEYFQGHSWNLNIKYPVLKTAKCPERKGNYWPDCNEYRCKSPQQDNGKLNTKKSPKGSYNMMK